MIFNSFEYLLFLPVVAFITWFMPRNWCVLFLLLASYIFYAFWKWEYLCLILCTTFSSFIAAKKIAKSSISKKKWLLFAVLVNISILIFYKYSNFLIKNVNFLLAMIEEGWEIPLIDVILPVGISFYTFQSIGYCIDVYRDSRKKENCLKKYSLYITFFPQLVAGPIERASNLLPQFKNIDGFNNNRCVNGVLLITWGLFKKVVIADRLAIYVDQVYGDWANYPAPFLALATVFFGIQIYCDFSGYSDIARGSARILGIRLMNNFNKPYFSLSITDFWRNWHISLSTWFRDYIYIPLGGSRVELLWHCRNIIVVFLISGIWHGASWTFLVWGGFHGILMVFEILISRIIKLPKVRHEGLVKVIQFTRWCYVIIAVNCAWIFFRADTIDDAFGILYEISFMVGNLSLWSFSYIQLEIGNTFSLAELFFSFLFILLLFSVEYKDRKILFIMHLRKLFFPVRYFIYAILLSIFLLFRVSRPESSFIYFQF